MEGQRTGFLNSAKYSIKMIQTLRHWEDPSLLEPGKEQVQSPTRKLRTWSCPTCPVDDPKGPAPGSVSEMPSETETKATVEVCSIKQTLIEGVKPGWPLPLWLHLLVLVPQVTGKEACFLMRVQKLVSIPKLVYVDWFRSLSLWLACNLFSSIFLSWEQESSHTHLCFKALGIREGTLQLNCLYTVHSLCLEHFPRDLHRQFISFTLQISTEILPSAQGSSTVCSLCRFPISLYFDIFSWLLINFSLLFLQFEYDMPSYIT